MLRKLDLLVGLLACVSANALMAQSSQCHPPTSDAPEAALRLAVKLVTYSEGTFFQNGTGILIGDHGDTLFVATAAHVVLDAGKPVDSVHASFYTDCDTKVAARICRPNDIKRDLDLAILCVSAAAAPGAKPPSLARLGNVGRLGARTPVYPVGCPEGKCWAVGQPDKVLVAGEKQSRILFTTFFVAAGHSGGPLFNEWFEVVGMLTKHGQPLSEAIPIDSVLNTACDKECRNARQQADRLESPYVPRGGYPLSLGVNALFGPADAEPGDRPAPVRINVMYRLSPLVELHAGGLRLTPENLSVTGVMMGLGMNLPPKKRWLGIWVNPFLEGGFGHVEGRFQTGSYFIDDNGTNVEVPIWQQVKDDGLGYGVGASVMALVAPHTIIEVIGGHWSFNRPAGAPEMPDMVWGAGLRWGF